MTNIETFAPEELGAEAGTLLPAKEVLSLLDVNVDINLALDLVAPIDLAVAGNLNVAAPISGSVSASRRGSAERQRSGADRSIRVRERRVGGIRICGRDRPAGHHPSDAGRCDRQGNSHAGRRHQPVALVA